MAALAVWAVMTASLVPQARGQNPPGAGGSAGGQAGPTMAQFNKLQTEVREQRLLIVQMLQAEQQRYDMLLKLLRVQGTTAALPEPVRLPVAAAPPTAEPALPADPPAGHPREDAAPAERGRKSGTVSGRVTFAGNDDGADIYVFIENVKPVPVRGRTVEIKQENKQFSPRQTVVQPGTNLVFPNLDSVYHNVFSNSARNSFDLGTSRSGDKPRVVTLTKTGVVEIFCNMHQKMSASVLVVPSPLYAKARPDGTFRIDNVPFGARKVVAWSPRAQSAEQRVDLTPAGAGAQVTFALKPDERKAHLNKLGQAYGSYRD